MSTKKPKILIVFARHGSDTSTKFGGFVKRLRNNGGFAYADVDYVALEDLRFRIIDATHTEVVDPVRGIDLAQYAFVYFKSWQSMPELAAAAAAYLEACGIPYVDRQVRHEYVAKTTNYMQMWAQGVPVPATVWGSREVMLGYLESPDVTYPLIIKAVHGQKGKDNYLVDTKEAASTIISESAVEMLIQQFIPNSGDYRIGVYGNRARWGIYRRSGGESHLNNTSAGATAELLDMGQVDSRILEVAEKAARACDLSISGVDVVQDATTGALYVFEANQGSQIVTGAFADTNMVAFDEGMKRLVTRRYSVRERQIRPVIGRHAVVILTHGDAPLEVVAKVDTGAYQSAMNADNIFHGYDEDGREYVEYRMKIKEQMAGPTIRTYEFWRARVQSSIGEVQERFVVPMQLEIQGVRYDTRVTLADRSKHKYPLLLGRKLLRGNFLVNVELAELEESK